LLLVSHIPVTAQVAGIFLWSGPALAEFGVFPRLAGCLRGRKFSATCNGMALAIGDHRISREEYLQGELASEIRHEYVAGNVYAMSGGTLNHQLIAGNFLRMAGNQLAGKPCFPTGSDFKLHVPLGGGEEAFYYPDGMIICVPVPGDALFTDSPSVILEVLSPNTRRIDEIQKFRDYITIPSLQTYILAETESPFLTLHRRDGAGFRREILTGPDAILELPEAGIAMSLAELYRDVV
jgi:Uma2 family endonuclease